MYRRIVSFVVAAAFLVIPVHAGAQDARPGQAYRGLFGPNTITAAEALTIRGAIGAGWDSNFFLTHSEEGFLLAPTTAPRNSGVYSLYSGGIGYSKSGASLQFYAAESSSARRYPDYPLLASHTAAAGISWAPSKRFEFSSSHDFVYQPWQTLTSFPARFGIPPRFDEAVAPNQAYASVGGESRFYVTSSSVTTQLSRQSSLTAAYSYQRGTFHNSAAFAGPFQFNVFATGDGRLTNQSGLVRYNQGVTRNLGWHAGYGYSEARYAGDVRRYRGHTLDVGVDYARALSITRRTSLSFSTGAIAVEQADQTQPQRRYNLNALATLTREIGRTWAASASYVRNVEYLQTLRLPYFYDRVTLQLAGLVTRRTGFHSSAGATYGDLGIDRNRSQRAHFDTESANVGMSFAMTRYLAVNADYVFYMYSFNRIGVNLPGIAQRPHRHDVLVTVSAWAPLFERGRKTNAAR